MNVRIKTKDWHPAGDEWREAIGLLSDGAFKLFALVCLSADRASGGLACRQAELARAMGKSRRSVGTYLQELCDKGLCRHSSSPNQHAAGILRVCERYWPYETVEPGDPGRTPGATPPDYEDEVRRFLESRPCVRCRWSEGDQRLAASWRALGVALEDVEQAVLMGCGRKYVSWLNGGFGEPIGSLRYFEPVLEEVHSWRLSPDYREFNRFQVERMESRWLAKRAQKADSPGSWPSSGMLAKSLRKQDAPEKEK